MTEKSKEKGYYLVYIIEAEGFIDLLKEKKFILDQRNPEVFKWKSPFKSISSEQIVKYLLVDNRFYDELREEIEDFFPIKNNHLWSRWFKSLVYIINQEEKDIISITTLLRLSE
jgi:hypothetical protein